MRFNLATKRKNSEKGNCGEFYSRFGDLTDVNNYIRKFNQFSKTF